MKLLNVQEGLGCQQLLGRQLVINRLRGSCWAKMSGDTFCSCSSCGCSCWVLIIKQQLTRNTCNTAAAVLAAATVSAAVPAYNCARGRPLQL